MLNNKFKIFLKEYINYIMYNKNDCFIRLLLPF